MSGDTYLRHIKAIIATFGHAVQYVGGDPETGARPFAYTIGLHRSSGRDYELAVSGLGPEASAGVLALLAEALSENDTPPSAGLQVRNLLELGLDLRLRLVSRPDELAVIRLVYGAAPTVWQALWPDLANRFPGDPAYDLADELQELL